MIETLPRGLGSGLRAFCRTISAEPPRFVPSTPAWDALPSSCFDNVAREIGREGGGVSHGWAVWHLRGLYFEAEHHGVWLRPDGELFDVSPQAGGVDRILFLPDRAAVFDQARFRSNVMAADGKGASASEFVALATRRTGIIDGYRAAGRTSVIMVLADRIEVARLLARMGELLAKRAPNA